MTEREEDPTIEEIQRVGRYWAKVKMLTCEHSNGIAVDPDGMTCPDCGQPLRFLSEIQIEELRSVPRSS